MKKHHFSTNTVHTEWISNSRMIPGSVREREKKPGLIKASELVSVMSALLLILSVVSIRGWLFRDQNFAWTLSIQGFMCVVLV